MSITEISLENYQQEITKSEKPVLLDFYADWCMPCKALTPILEEMAGEYDKVKICRIDAEKHADLSMIYGIISVPVLVLIKGDKEIARKMGVCEKQDLIDFCDENI